MVIGVARAINVTAPSKRVAVRMLASFVSNGSDDNRVNLTVPSIFELVNRASCQLDSDAKAAANCRGVHGKPPVHEA